MIRRRWNLSAVRIHGLAFSFLSSVVAIAASSEPSLSRKAFDGLSAFGYRLSGSLCLMRDRTGQEITHAVGSEVELLLDKGLATERAIRVRCAHVLLDLERGDKGEVVAAWILAR